MTNIFSIRTEYLILFQNLSKLCVSAHLPPLMEYPCLPVLNWSSFKISWNILISLRHFIHYKLLWPLLRTYIIIYVRYTSRFPGLETSLCSHSLWHTEGLKEMQFTGQELEPHRARCEAHLISYPTVGKFPSLILFPSCKMGIAPPPLQGCFKNQR